MPQARKYIAETMGVQYAEGVILDIHGMWEEANSRVPMIGLLSLGSDPTNNIDTLSKKLGLGRNCVFGGQCSLDTFIPKASFEHSFP